MQLITLGNGTTLAFSDCGADRGAATDPRPALLFSHCLGGSHAVWAAQREFFCKLRPAGGTAGIRCVAYDIRGQGQSPVAPQHGTEARMAELADDALGLLDALGIDSCVFVGISMGGMIGQHLALKAPERVAGLVIADSAGGFDPAGRSAWAERIAQVRRDGLAPLVDSMMERWLSDGYRARHPAVVAALSKVLRDCPVDGYVASCAAIRDHDLRARLGEIRCPTLVLCGEDDPSTPLALSQALAAAIPGAALTVFPKVRHLPCIECPDAFNDALDRFLDTLGAGRTPH